MNEPQQNGKPVSPFAQGYQMPPAYTPRPKEYYPLQKRDNIYAVLALIVGVLSVSLSLWGEFMIGFTVSYVLFFAVMTAYLARRPEKVRLFPLLCAVLALAGSAVFALTDCTDVNFFLLLMMFALTAVWFSSFRKPYLPTTDLGLIGSLFSSTFGKAFGGLGTAMRSLFRKKNGKAGNLGKVLVGAACAIPVLVIVLPLLVSSDAAFEGLITDILDDLVETFAKILLGAAFGALLISYGFAHRMGKPTEEKKSGFAGLEGVFVSSFLGMISLCYLAYLFSQLAYFFNGFAGILPKEFNAADYARRGFFEMSAIAVINLLLLFGTLALSKKKDGRLSLPVLIFSLFIDLFTLVIISTALSKMVMYMNRFGLTRLRITTSAFMVFLGTVFLALFVKYFAPKTPVVKIGMVTGTCILLLLGFGNVDRVVAEYNIGAYRSGALTALDVDAIGELGATAVPYLAELTEDENEKIAESARKQLDSKILAMYELRDGKFVRPKAELGAWNLTVSRAYQALEKYIPDDPMPLILWEHGYEKNEIIGKSAYDIEMRYGTFDDREERETQSEPDGYYLLETDLTQNTFLRIRFADGVAYAMDFVTK